MLNVAGLHVADIFSVFLERFLPLSLFLPLKQNRIDLFLVLIFFLRNNALVLGSLTTNSLSKMLNDVTTSEDDIPWYDRDDDGDVDDVLSVKERPKHRNVEQETGEKLGKCMVMPYHVCKVNELDQSGKCYPFDIWSLLAKYIKPEQIQTFAGICREANQAVNSVSFWIRLYKTFVKDTSGLPDRLKPNWIESRAGLKMRVVRALFIGYSNLRNNFLRETLEGTRNTQAVSELVGLQCCHSWFKLVASSAKPNNSCVFYYKFKRDAPKIVSKHSLSNFDDERDYLIWNYERSFIVLQITMSNFVHLESVCGETLTDISVNLSRNMRYHSLKMVFHCFRKDGKYRKNDGTVLVLDPVCEFRVLRWWYPTYPHPDE